MEKAPIANLWKPTIKGISYILEIPTVLKSVEIAKSSPGEKKTPGHIGPFPYIGFADNMDIATFI